jgi:hypothetical protein
VCDGWAVGFSISALLYEAFAGRQWLKAKSGAVARA